MTMSRVLEAVFLLVIGGLLILFRVQYERFVADWQNRLWGLRYGEFATRAVVVVNMIVGIGFVVAGILRLVGVGKA